MTFRRPINFLRLFLVFTAIGTFFAIHTYLSGSEDSLSVRFYFEMTGAWAAMLLVPGLAWLVRIAPITRATLPRAIAANIAGLVGYTLLHSTLEITMRYLAQPLIGRHAALGTMALLTYPSEAAGDIVYYAFIVASLYLIERFITMNELEAKLAEAKLENLLLQLQPHFLFNTLNAISAVMYEDVARADAMLSRLSEFLRAVLDSGTVNEVSLDDELAIEQMYISIMTTRLERDLDLRIDIADDARGCAVPFMLLQPLLENSIQHGMGSAGSSLALSINVARSNGTTVITVEDDGVGFHDRATRGIGLTNTASRLAYMYGDRASFSIASRAEGGTRATITLPYATGVSK